jgi:hypothetical protein
MSIVESTWFPFVAFPAMALLITLVGKLAYTAGKLRQGDLWRELPWGEGAGYRGSELADEDAPVEGDVRLNVFGGTNVHFDPANPPDYYRKDFMCRCGPSQRGGKVIKWVKGADPAENDGDGNEYGAWVKTGEDYAPSDNQAEAQAVYEEVLRRLDATPEDLLTHVVTSLNWDYSAHITGIANDQWSGVSAETYSVSYPRDDEAPRLKVYVQCDRIEDGIARVWKFFADELGLTDGGELVYSDADGQAKQEDADGPVPG